MNRNIINKAFIKDRKEILAQKPTSIPTKNSIKSTSSSKKTVSTISSSSLSRIGRPVGFLQVKNEIACKFAAFKKSQRNGKHMRKGQLEEIITKIKQKNNIDAEILPSAIRQRVERNSLQNHQVAGGQISPLLRMELVMVQIIMQIIRIRQCLTPSKWF